MQIVNRVRLYRRRHGALASWAYYWLVVANQMSRVPRGRTESWHAVVALLRPGRRPAELGCSGRRMPR
jgi:N-acetylglucosaminyl-diphospho-decaprenol L-rhamnosyltransferase